MKFSLSALTAAVLIVSAPWAAAQNVAIVNGKAVPTARVDALVKQIEGSGRAVDDTVRAQIREEVILREIFMQEAVKRGVGTTPEFKTQMELARQTIMIRSLFAEYQKANPVTDAEVKAEYDKFAAANSGKEFRARHILVEKEDEAKALIAEICKPALGFCFKVLANFASSVSAKAPFCKLLAKTGPLLTLYNTSRLLASTSIKS